MTDYDYIFNISSNIEFKFDTLLKYPCCYQIIIEKYDQDHIEKIFIDNYLVYRKGGHISFPFQAELTSKYLIIINSKETRNFEIKLNVYNKTLSFNRFYNNIKKNYEDSSPSLKPKCFSKIEDFIEKPYSHFKTAKIEVAKITCISKREKFFNYQSEFEFYLTNERNLIINQLLNFLDSEILYNHLIILGPLGVGKSVTLMLFLLYLKFKKNKIVLYYNFEFCDDDSLKGICEDLLMKIYTFYNNDLILKEAIITILYLLDMDKLNLAYLIEQIQIKYPLLNDLVIILDQVNRLDKKYLVDMNDNIKHYLCYSNNNKIAKNIYIDYFDKGTLHNQKIIEITKCINKISEIDYFIFSSSNEIDENKILLLNHSNNNLKLLSNYIKKYNSCSGFKDIDIIVNQTLYDLKIEDKMDKFILNLNENSLKLFKKLLIEYIDEDVSIKYDYFIYHLKNIFDYKLFYICDENNHFINFTDLNDKKTELYLKCISPIIRNMYMKKIFKNDNYNTLYNLYYDPNYKNCRGFLFENIILNYIKKTQRFNFGSLEYHNLQIYTFYELNGISYITIECKKNILQLKENKSICFIPININEKYFDCYFLRKDDSNKYSMYFTQFTIKNYREVLKLTIFKDYYSEMFKEFRNSGLNITKVYVYYLTNSSTKLSGINDTRYGWTIVKIDENEIRYSELKKAENLFEGYSTHIKVKTKYKYGNEKTERKYKK